MVRSWLTAAQELEIRVQAPASVDLGVGEPVDCIALVLDFGSPRGTALISLEPDHDLALVSSTRDHEQYAFVSILGSSYERFERARFIETLSDWGWFGEGQPPAWYSAVR